MEISVPYPQLGYSIIQKFALAKCYGLRETGLRACWSQCYPWDPSVSDTFPVNCLGKNSDSFQFEVHIEYLKLFGQPGGSMDRLRRAANCADDYDLFRVEPGGW